MIIKDEYYVLRTKTTPIKFYNDDEENCLVDDFRMALKFKGRKTVELYMCSENERIRRIRNIENDTYDFFEIYDPMFVKATYEF